MLCFAFLGLKLWEQRFTFCDLYQLYHGNSVCFIKWWGWELGVMAPACYLSACKVDTGASGGQGQLHSKSEVGLGCMRPYLKQNPANQANKIKSEFDSIQMNSCPLVFAKDSCRNFHICKDQRMLKPFIYNFELCNVYINHT